MIDYEFWCNMMAIVSTTIFLLISMFISSENNIFDFDNNKKFEFRISLLLMTYDILALVMWTWTLINALHEVISGLSEFIGWIVVLVIAIITSIYVLLHKK